VSLEERSYRERTVGEWKRKQKFQGYEPKNIHNAAEIGLLRH
jgi:hypothetical protein